MVDLKEIIKGFCEKCKLELYDNYEINVTDISEYVSYSGEVYSEELLSTAGEEYSNCPMVFSFFGRKGLYYDKIDTSMGGASWVSMNKSMHLVDLYRYLSKYTSYPKELSLKIARNRENIDTLIYRIDADELVER